MKSQLAAVMERTPEPELAKRISEKISNQFSQISDGIARRAFDIFESRGRSPGHELEDWFRAESELLRGSSERSRVGWRVYRPGGGAGLWRQGYRGHCGAALPGDFRRARNEGKRTEWKNDPLRVARRKILSGRRSTAICRYL